MFLITRLSCIFLLTLRKTLCSLHKCPKKVSKSLCKGGRGGIYACVYFAPLHYPLQGEVAQAVSKALLRQLHISATGETGEHHHKGWALLASSPWIRPVSWRPLHGWRWRVGTSKQQFIFLKKKQEISRCRGKKALSLTNTYSLFLSTAHVKLI